MDESVLLEIERKYDITTQASLPRLHGAAGVSRAQYRPPVTLEAVYFDTRDRVLAANGVILRRRAGGPDAGWHVKIPSGAHRIEMQVPLSSAERTDGGPAETAPYRVPKEIADLVRVHVRRRTLLPVLSMNTLRSVVELMDAQGRVMAEVCDDQVAAMAAGSRADSRVRHWREWEVEVVNPTLLGGPESVPAFLDAVESALLAAGARPSEAGSKLEKVLGRPADPLDPEALGEAADLGSVLTRAARIQVRRLKSWDPLVRRDVEDSVHQYRVAARTLRSVLQIYAPLLDPEPRTAIDSVLKKLGRLLSAARDAEVLRDQVDERIAALPGGADGRTAALIPVKAARRLRRTKAEEYRTAHADLLRALRSRRYAEQLDLIDAYAQRVPLSPDLTEEQRSDAAAALGPLASAQVDSLLEHAARAESEADEAERIELLHEVRKEAKRLRYAVAAVEEGSSLDLGADLQDRMTVAKKLQTALGTHRDSVMFQDYVLATARRAEKKGEKSFGYGILHAAELPVQAKALKKTAKLLARLHPGDGAE